MCKVPFIKIFVEKRAKPFEIFKNYGIINYNSIK